MTEVLRVMLASILGVGLTLAIQLWDRRRLTEEQRAGAWNGASWASALYAFGPLSMIAWAWVTRHEWSRWRRASKQIALEKSAALLGKGLLATLLIAGAIVVLDALIGLAVGE